MHEFRSRLGENGRLVIPVLCRKQLHLEAGEELVLRVEDHVLYIFTLKHAVERAQQLVQRYAKNKSLVNKLHSLRQEDNENE